MTIMAVMGMPGSGKSYFLASRAKAALEEGRKVYCNFYMVGTYKFTLDDLVNYAFEEGSLILVDEAGKWFNSRNWSDLPPEVYELFTLHRHLGLDMIMAVQSFNRVDKSLREVVELTYIARKHLFHFSYRGYYEVERIGKIKGEEDVKKLVRRSRKINRMYDTKAMKNAFHGKPLIQTTKYALLPKSKITIYKRYIRFRLYLLRSGIKNRFA